MAVTTALGTFLDSSPVLTGDDAVPPPAVLEDVGDGAPTLRAEVAADMLGALGNSDAVAFVDDELRSRALMMNPDAVMAGNEVSEPCSWLLVNTSISLIFKQPRFL